MRTAEFLVTYRPFPGSDMTAELTINAVDDADCKIVFERLYPLWQFVSSRETMVQGD